MSAGGESRTLMSAAIQTPFVAERDDFRLALHDGYATLSVDEQATDVADVLAECLPADQLPNWTVQPVGSDGKWEVYLLRLEPQTKLV